MNKPQLILLSDIVQQQLEKGEHPRTVRRTLQQAGIRWRYQFSTSVAGTQGPIRTQVQGLRETARRARQLKLCAGGCGRVGIRNIAQTCTDCLEARWKAAAP